MSSLFRKIFEIEGIVQGVGFRPAIYCFAVDSGLGGWIRNCSGKVLLCIEGKGKRIDTFIEALPAKLPLHARIDNIQFVSCASISIISEFRILESERDSDFKASIPADIAICADCEKEIINSLDRRYKYPFTTCVNCGPRYTVINAMPYDRCRTTLVNFPLCLGCEKEYGDPKNRRFHAESIACSVCGPRLFLLDSDGNESKCDDPLNMTIDEIVNGKIVAIRGIGGFLLAINAFNRKAIHCLRKRKTRPHKPFAVMAKDMSIVRKYCNVNEVETKALKSFSAPIVILDVKNGIDNLPIDLLSPDTNTLGVMLPYSPLHKLLFYKTGLDLLVMTSGNKGGEPICIKNEEAFERLNNIADYILCHNREINLRNDDSLCTMQDGNMQIWRRARGFAPEPMKTNFRFKRTVLCMGAELKNCIALAYDHEIVVSPHIGDLETPEAVDSLKLVVKCFPDFLKKRTEIIAVDLHPDMHSTRLGLELAKKMDIPIVKVQHHHAHAASCMAEHGVKKALALVFDGTGLGTDGAIWGAEALYIKGGDFSRLATFKPVPLPGGDTAVYYPARQLVARFHAAGIKMTEKMLANYGMTAEEYKIWRIQCDRGINAPLTHAAGRLFDAFSIWLGLSSLTRQEPIDFSKLDRKPCLQSNHNPFCNKDRFAYTYEGQGAIRLEAEAKRALNKGLKPLSLPFNVIEKNKMLYIDWDGLFLFLSDENKKILNGDKHQVISTMALSFHKTVVAAAIKMLDYSLSKITTENIVLSGGVFMNKILTDFLVEEIKNKGLNVYIHREIPPNDGGISLGQAVICNKQP